MKRHRNSKLPICLILLLMLSFSNGSNISVLASNTPNTVLNPNEVADRVGEATKSAPNPSNPMILYLSNVTTLQSTAEQITELVNMSTVQTITSSLSSYDNRYTGTQGSLSAISYIQGFLRTNCSIQNVYLDNFTFNDQGTLIQASNIIAKVGASNQTSKTLLVTAHHDSIGYQYPFNVYSTGAKGADDDASGVATALETARVLSMFRQYLKNNVLFIIFAAEEGNKTTDPSFMRQGSTHWISSNHPGVDSLQDVIGVVNLDGVAYKYGGSIGVYHHDSGDGVAANVTSTANMLGIPAQDEEHARTDSYFNLVRCRTEDTFHNADVPAVTLSTHYTNPFTHTPQDTLSNLNFNEAINFTKTVLSYIYLASGVTPEHEKTYTTGWVSTISPNGRYMLNETNYADALVRHGILNGYQLIILDPSLAGMNPNNLLSIASACNAAGRRLPILTLGKAGAELLGILAQNLVETKGQYPSNSDLVHYVSNSLTGLSHHPVFNSPNNIAFTYENATTLSYKVVTGEAVGGDSGHCYLVRDTIGTSSPFLQLGYTPYGGEPWSWLGVLHAHNSSCGPVGFIGIDNASTLTVVAQEIAENMVYWLLNNPGTAIIVEPSETNPLVGDHVEINVALRDPLTWEAKSSIPFWLKLTSPSGKLLLSLVEATDQNGAAESSSIFLTEIGEYTANTTLSIDGGRNTPGTITTFRASPRINADCECGASVIQGESTKIQMNLSYIPTTPEAMRLMLRGKALTSNLSIGMTFNHGYNYVNLTIPIREAIPAGEYNLTLTIAPTTMEFVACQENIGILVKQAYDITIIQAPETMTQGSISRLVVQITSHRTTTVNGTLRIESTAITLTGEAPITMSAGETQQITLQVEESSTSPYDWGAGEMRISLIRNGSPVADSQPIPLFVSMSSANLFLGYVLPPTLLAAILIERLRKTRVKKAGVGTLLGGSLFFAFGLLISQSMFMVVPLAMLVAGSYIGTAAVQYTYDKPLPKGYDWHIPREATEGKGGNHS